MDRMLTRPGAAANIEAVIGLALDGKVKEAFREMHGGKRAWGLGTAFGSKLLYFAGFDKVRSGPQPLILDSFVAKGLTKVIAPVSGEPSEWDSSTTEWSHYEAYLNLVQRIRDKYVSGSRLDMVEEWLWYVGGRP